VAAVKRGLIVGGLLRCEGKDHITVFSWCSCSIHQKGEGGLAKMPAMVVVAAAAAATVRMPEDTSQVIYLFPVLSRFVVSRAMRKIKYSNERSHPSVGQTVISLGMILWHYWLPVHRYWDRQSFFHSYSHSLAHSLTLPRILALFLKYSVSRSPPKSYR